MRASNLWLLLLVIALLAGAVGFVAYRANQLVADPPPTPEPSPTRPVDLGPAADPVHQPSVVAINTPAAVFGPSVPASPAEAAEFGKLFVLLPTGGKGPKGEVLTPGALPPHVDRMVADRARLWAGARPGQKPTWRDWSGWSTAGGGGLLVAPLDEYQWSAVEVIRVAYTPDRAEAMVTVRAVPVDGGGPRVSRYKLARTPDGWAEYDQADGRPWLWQNAARADLEAGATTTTDGERVGRVAAAVYKAVYGSNPAELDKLLAEVRGKPLAPAVAAWRAYAEGRLLLLKKDAAGAAKAFAEAVAADPTWPMGHIGRADALTQLGQAAEADKDRKAADALIGS